MGQCATRGQQENNILVLYTTWQLFHLETILERGRFLMRVEREHCHIYSWLEDAQKIKDVNNLKNICISNFFYYLTKLRLSNTEVFSGRI